MASENQGTNISSGRSGEHLKKDGNGYATELERKYPSDLTDEAYIKRRIFASAYVENGCDKTAAAREAGFKSPAVKGQKLFKEPLVKKLIFDLIDKRDDLAVVSAARINFRLAEIGFGEETNLNVAVSALNTLSKNQHLQTPDTGATINNNGGVMVVPGMVDPDTWAEAAMKAQEELKKQVRT